MAKNIVEEAWDKYVETLEPVRATHGVLAAAVKAMAELPEPLRASMHITFEHARETYNQSLDAEGKAHDRYCQVCDQPDLFSGATGTIFHNEGGEDQPFDLSDWTVEGADVIDARAGRVKAHPNQKTLVLKSRVRDGVRFWCHVGEHGEKWRLTATPLTELNGPDKPTKPRGRKSSKRSAAERAINAS